MIKESFAAFEQQNTNYIFYVFRKLGLLDTGMDKQNHLTIFWQELIKNNQELAAFVNEFKRNYHLYYHNRKLQDLMI